MCPKFLAPRLGPSKLSECGYVPSEPFSKTQRPHLPGGYKTHHCVYHRLGGRRMNTNWVHKAHQHGACWLHIASLHPGHILKKSTLSFPFDRERHQNPGQVKEYVTEGTEKSEVETHEMKQNCAKSCSPWPYL